MTERMTTTTTPTDVDFDHTTTTFPFDAADHMKGTLELIAGHECIVQPTARIRSHDGTAYVEDVHQVRGDRSLSRGRFAPDTCPVCMARKCLEQIEDAERGVIA